MTSAAVAFCLVLAFAPWSGKTAAAKQREALSGSSHYFAEGYTAPGFQEYLCLANPSTTPATVNVRFLFNGGSAAVERTVVPPLSRTTLDVNYMVGIGREVSMVVTSDVSTLKAERPMYFDYQGRLQGSSCTDGAPAPSRTWYFAEGCTLGGFDEYLTVLNPDERDASLTLTFQTSTRGEVTVRRSVRAGNRATFKVNDILGEGLECSTVIRSDRPVVAERPMYFDYVSREGARVRGGHCVTGATGVSKTRYFAEGTTRPGFDEWLTVQNAGTAAIEVEATFHPGPGQGSASARTYSVGAGSRRTIDVAAQAGTGKDVSVVLRSQAPFLAERPMYYAFSRDGLYFEGGHCGLGSPEPDGEAFFAEGYTGACFEEWLCVQNSSSARSVVELTYMTARGAVLEPHRLVLEPGSRQTVLVNESAGPGLEVAVRARLISGKGTFVERSMYVDTTRWRMPEPRVRKDLYGLCFSPFVNSDPRAGGTVSDSLVDRLLEKIAPYSSWVRTFGSRGEWDVMASVARRKGMMVAGGCDVSADGARSAAAVAAVARQAGEGRIDMAVIGDETLFGGVLSEDELISYIRQVKGRGVPVGTSDVWSEFIEHPRLTAECDVVLMNVYPYFEGVPAEEAAARVMSCYDRVVDAAGGKPVIIETGWPTGGVTRGAAVPGEAQSARFMTDFLAMANLRRIPYFYFEAFDEPWKASCEGPTGACWGIWDSKADIKPPHSGVIDFKLHCQ